MISLISENQPLFALGFLIFLVVTVLLILQYAVIRYGQQLFTQAIRCWVRTKRSLAKNKRIILFRGKYPKLDVIMSRRFDLRDFHGLSLTFLWVVIGCMLVLFIALAEAVATLNSIVSIDYFISAQMSLLRDSDVVGFFVLITSFASTPIAVLVVLFVAVNCWVKQQRYIIVGLLIATLGSTAFTSLLKYLFQRERPANSLLVVQTYSFPSGHATTAMALYGFIAYLLIRFNQNFAQKIRIFTIAILFILLIGLSRVVLNQHYLSDVLGGYLVGAFWLTLGISITEWLSVESKIIWKVEWSTSHAYMIWLSGLGVFISTLIYAKIYQFPMLS
ncbi:phosphatase PAP2 family protein [uncultured Psychrobacter sp.]|uniref:phosphatase PAP2 family protein n=1 Tax=uncultured Psychrobacter sp. TaxID=259303 RepID=UPI00262DDB73|nr:phosphatase PAP2 family protein [uncultured Psychrobacter sp.]